MRGLGRHRWLGLPAGMLALTAAVLATDAATRNAWAQAALAVVAMLLLAWLLHGGSAWERRMVCSCIVIATGVEVFGSVIWGAYRYRLGGVPAYVPLGHGLVYLTSLRVGASPALASHRELARRSAAAVAVAWGIAGLTLIPALGGRRDVFGAVWAGVFLVVLWRTSRPGFFAAMFVLTSALELLGTGFGDWAWAARVPVLGVAAGNPPSVIAGAYALLDALVLRSGRLRLPRATRRRREATTPASSFLDTTAVT